LSMSPDFYEISNVIF